ncbi:TPA: hypothetical protein HA239_01300 [Candidatus Woesearchaeota archaeon]|nr:hypothetical protein QT06_C0001G0426 [archaeon GW2011_AR15]MBS3103737.1 hypothetical protein [Candidatus Woesearchaeota archaeon]HIH41028.1 hypothetical protein [Candidatus Woesearchaeota archaeon]
MKKQNEPENEDEILRRLGLDPVKDYQLIHDTLSLYYAKPRPEKIRIIEFRPSDLTDRMKQGIIDIGLVAFGPGMTPEEIIEHVMPTDRVYMGFKGTRAIGFATANIQENAVDFVGAAVEPQYQGDGLYNEFVMRRVSLAFEHGKNTVKLRTQNPVVYLGVTRSLDNLAEIGAINSYTEKREHVKGMYGRMLTEKRPLSNIGEINRIFDVLDYEKGDTFSLEFRMVR